MPVSKLTLLDLLWAIDQILAQIGINNRSHTQILRSQRTIDHAPDSQSIEVVLLDGWIGYSRINSVC